MKTKLPTTTDSHEANTVLPTVAGKSPDRVNKAYLKYPEDWKAQYNMLLMDGDTCGDCAHSERCKTLFDGDNSNTSCQFYPNKFMRKEPL